RAGDGELCTDDVDPGLAAPNRPAPQPHDGRAQIAGVDLQLFQLLAEFLSESGAAAPASAPARLPWLAFSIDLLAAIGDLGVQQERALQLDCFELAECEIGPAPSRAEAVMHVGKKQDGQRHRQRNQSCTAGRKCKNSAEQAPNHHANPRLIWPARSWCFAKR